MSDTPDSKPLSIYIIAGEASGDFLGGQLMAQLKQQSDRPIKFHGIGGDKMIAQGLDSLFPYNELSMMGFIEILPHAYNVMARIDSTVEDIRAKAPDMVITIDSPGFCFRVVRKLREYKLQSTFVHYVAPTVWAYKPERAKKCADLFDHMLLLLPFEPPYFEREGLACTFVGHPIVAETPTGDGTAFRKKYDIPVQQPLFTILPGSRRGEVQRHMPIFGRAVTLLARKYPQLAMAITVPRQVIPFVTDYFEGCPFRTVITSEEEDKRGAMAAANLAIVKSGTVALEVAMNHAPMVVAYRVNPISAWMVRRMITARYVNLINLLLDREVIPELLQENCTAFCIAQSAEQLLNYEENITAQESAAQEALTMLMPASEQKPSAIAARAVLGLLSSPKKK